MTTPNPEIAYANASAHWLNCPTCHRAGGAAAQPSDMCAAGRYLTHTWERAEQDYGPPQDIRDISVRQWAVIAVWSAVGLGLAWGLYVTADTIWQAMIS